MVSAWNANLRAQQEGAAHECISKSISVLYFPLHCLQRGAETHMPALSEETKGLNLVATDLQARCTLAFASASLHCLVVTGGAAVQALHACMPTTRPCLAANSLPSPPASPCRAAGTSCTTASGATQAPAAAGKTACWPAPVAVMARRAVFSSSVPLYSTLGLAPPPRHSFSLGLSPTTPPHPLSLTQDVRARAYRGAAEARASQAW